MLATTDKSGFLRGMRDGGPFLIIVVPFGMLFGVVAGESGLNLAETMGFSFLVIAGASQFAAVQLLTDNAPLILVLAGALAVNLRMAMYSASLTPYLGSAPLWKRVLIAYFLVDQTYALSIARYEARPEMSPGQRVGYYFGTVLPVVPFWYVGSLIGKVAGARIPEDWALDFIVPITFIAMVAPMLRTLAHRAAALTSVVVAVALAWMPSGTGLLVAGVAGMAAGAQVELWQERRR